MLKLARCTAWALVALLAFVTLAPIDLRPVMTESADVERALAYGLVGLAFSVAYPRHRWLALAAVVGVAGFLEFGQTLTHSRHGRLADFLVKAVAACLGALVAHLLIAARGRRSPS